MLIIRLEYVGAIAPRSVDDFMGTAVATSHVVD